MNRSDTTQRTSLHSLLDVNLNIVFIGTEPGKKSLECGHYYANPGNLFYRDLFTTGWICKELGYENDGELRTYGIGLDDVYFTPQSLKERLQKHKPKIVCFNSKTALQRYTGRNIRAGNAWEGNNASRYANFEWNPLTVWALYDSSRNACAYHEKRCELLRELKSKFNKLIIKNSN